MSLISAEEGRWQGERVYLHFTLHLLPRGDQVVQRLLSVLHVTAVLTVDQQPGGEMKLRVSVYIPFL